MRQLARLPFVVLLLALLAACGGQPAVGPAPSAPAAPTAAVATIAPTTAAEPTVAPTSAPTTAEATVAPTTAPTAEDTTAPTAAPTTTAGSSGELNVFAAASLTDAFKEIGTAFEAANAGAKLTFNFAGSQQLAQQIGQGAPADVFASANGTQMNNVIKSGEVVSGTQRTFVRNRLVVIFPKDNPGKIAAIKDLAIPGLKLVLADKAVPVGQYALDVLAKASKLPEYTETFSPTVLKNVVSYEDNVKAVLSKVALGEADAGIVYTSDIALDSAGKVGKLDIPDTLNVVASYPIAPIKDSSNAALAQKFVDYVLAPASQQVLVKYGFIPTTGSATGAAPKAGSLAITGKVKTPLTLQPADLQKIDLVEVKAIDKSGEQTFKGVLISTLLEMAGAAADAAKIVFTGGDGYTAEVTLAQLLADKDAIISIADDGSIRNILPTLKPKLWVKGLTTDE